MPQMIVCDIGRNRETRVTVGLVEGDVDAHLKVRALTDAHQRLLQHERPGDPYELDCWLDNLGLTEVKKIYQRLPCDSWRRMSYQTVPVDWLHVPLR